MATHTFRRRFIATACSMFAITALSTPALAGPSENKALVHKAMHELFVNRDVAAVERYWGDPYVQHNPMIPNGRNSLVGLVKSLPTDFRYEPGMIVAERDLVMLHGRYTGFGPKPLTTVDIFRIRNGKIVEHWDVMQEDIPPTSTKNGNAMFDPKE